MSEQKDWLQTELDELRSSPEGFHVKTLVSPESAPACPVSAAAYGPSFTELSLKHDPVGQSLRMYLGLELLELTQCSLTWQEQVTPLGRWWWVLSMPELHTDDSGCGLLPTPDASMHTGGRVSKHPPSVKTRPSGSKRSITLNDAVRWQMLPTPSATTYGRNKGGQNPDGKERPSLETMARGGVLPTPRAAAGMMSPLRNPENIKDKSRLEDAIAMQDGTGSGRLSAEFVSWMMNYPKGWTEVD